MDYKEATQLSKGLNKIVVNAEKLSEEAANLSQKINNLVSSATSNAETVATTNGIDPFIFAITIFVLACFIGYYVIWKVTPALHTPLMSVTNAISGIIIVGAMIAAGSMDFHFSKFLGFTAVLIASINIFGGFVVSQRMLSMFRKN